METADNPRDRSDLTLSVSEHDAMSRDGVDARESGRNGLMRPARGLVRFLYSSNPFYILSADLIFVGLRMSFGAGGPASRTLALLLGLGGYTLLMATTACVLIRLGNLWDDLRSLLLLIVMILMAIAMSGDDVMAADPGKGALVCLGGFLFAAVVTETVLRVIRLRLPGWYRTVYYLILALVFLYPLALAPFLTRPESPALQWALFGFSPLAGLALTALVPAARAGRARVAQNGSPWRWPLYPWSLFVVMVFGLGVRCSTLCVSFHFVEGHGTIFGPYFLVPIGLAVSLVWLEIGIASGRRRVMFVASSAPLFLVLLAMTGHRYEAVYQHFLGLFMASLGGSPAFVSLIAATLFFAYAVARGVPLAWELLSVGLLALTVVGPRTVDVFETVSPRWLPLSAAGVALGFAAWRHHDSLRAAVAAGFLVAGITLGWAIFFPHADLAAISIHLILMAMLVIGGVFDDLLAQVARSCGALLLLSLGFVSAVGYTGVSDSLPAALAPYYLAMVAAVAFGYGFLVRDQTYLASAFVCLAAWLGWSGWQLYAQLRKAVAGLDQIVWGLVFFSIAMAISLRKAGLWPRPMAKRLARMSIAMCRPYVGKSPWLKRFNGSSLQHADEGLRLAAIRALGTVGNEQTRERLIALLEDRTMPVRAGSDGISHIKISPGIREEARVAVARITARDLEQPQTPWWKFW